MKTRLYHTVNAGVYLSAKRTNLLIDGIHKGTDDGMSLMPEELKIALKSGIGIFDHIDGLLFTHLHTDHFCADGVRTVLQRFPETALFGPGLKRKALSGYTETDENQMFTIGDFRVLAYPTIHSGEIYKKEPHRSLLIQNMPDNEIVFIAGDAAFAPTLAEKIRREAACMIGKEQIDAAFINVFQLLERPSIAFLKELDPDRLFLYHRPKKEDDRYNYLPLIRSTLRNAPLSGRKIELPDHMTVVL